MALEHGYVRGTFTKITADGPDADRTPDKIGAIDTKVTFRPAVSVVDPTFTEESSQSGVTCSVAANGDLIDPQGAVGVWLVTGQYSVSFNEGFTARTIVVNGAHTLAAPLWLAAARDYTAPPGTTTQVFELPAGRAAGQTLGGEGSAIEWVDAPRDGIDGVDSVDHAAAVEARALSRGTDLVTNGTGYLESNYSFSEFIYDPTDAPTGAVGSFLTPSSTQATQFVDETMPVSTSKQYLLSVFARETNDAVTGGRLFVGLVPVAADGASIAPSDYMYRPGTTTELAQPLAPGDTVVNVQSTAGWIADGAANHIRTIIVWDYTDGNGKLWPAETYSQINWSDAYDTLTATTIPLKTPWTGTTHAIGTQISNGGSGNNFMYQGWANDVVTSEWQTKSGTVGPGVHSQEGSGWSAAGDKFPPGTAGAKIIFLTNRGTTGTRQAIGGVSLSDVSAAAQSAANNALTLADVLARLTALEGA